MSTSDNKTAKGIWMIFLFVAVFWPILFLNRGIDLTDTGYYLANYSHILKNPEKFGIGTYLSNYFGGLIYSALPSHHLMILKLINTIANGISIVLSFLVMKKYFNKNALAFLIMLASFALARYPQCLSYNTFSVLFLSLSVFVLSKWLSNKKGYLLVLLGIIIGLSVFFRLPNLLFASLCLCVLLNDILTDEKKNIINDTVKMLIGGILGIGVGLVFVICCVGISSFASGMNQYVEMGSDASNSHGIKTMFILFASQVRNGIYNHIYYIAFSVIFLIALIFIIYRHRDDHKNIAVIVALTYTMSVILTAFRYHQVFDIFTYNQVLTSILMTAAITIPVSVFSIFHYRKTNANLSTISAIVLLISVIICFGTDNGLFQHIIVFFWLLPYTTIIFHKLIKEYYYSKTTVFSSAVLSVCIIMLVNVLASNTYSDIVFAFTNQYREAPYSETKYNVDNKCLAGVRTTETKAVMLGKITKFMSNEEYKHNKVLAMNSIPIIFALIDNDNLVDTSFWPDLESCQIGKLKFALQDAQESNDLPIIIIYHLNSKGEVIEEDSEKVAYVKNFCDSMNYKVADEVLLDGKTIYTILVP